MHRLSFHEVSHDAVHYFTHADKSIFSLVKDLAIRPGFIAKAYINGQRKKYFKQINFLLIVAEIVVFMTSSLSRPNDIRSQQMKAAAERMKNPVAKQQMLAMAARAEKVNKVTGKYSNVINIVATPLLTLIFWLAYRRRVNYVESLVANMYFVGFIMLFYSLLIVPLQYFFPAAGSYLIALFFLFEFIYRGRAFYQLQDRTGAAAIVKAYGISLLMSIIWVLITYSIIVYYIRTGF
jgi:hypothetical protein